MIDAKTGILRVEDGQIVLEDSQSIFYLGRTSYKQTLLLSWLLFSCFFLCAIISAALSARLLPGYVHTFTLYLKWQDVLVASFWFIAFISLGGCVLVVRFLFALRAGHHEGMLILDDEIALTARDLSPKNLASIIRAIGAAFSCFIVAVVGLVPAMLIGWTSHLSQPALAVVGTTVAIVLSIVGVALSLIAIAFIFIGVVGCISFCQKMGAPQTYQLIHQTVLRIDGFVLTIIYPDKPESMIDLNLLDAADQHQLLSLLHKRWLAAQSPWNPRLGEEIEEALEETERFTLPV